MALPCAENALVTLFFGVTLPPAYLPQAVVVASLDVDEVLNRIDYERAQVIELRDVLRSNRDRAVGTTSVATLAIGTGLGVVSGVLQFSDSTKGAGNVIGFAAGGISTLLSFHSIRQQRSGKRPAWVLPDMLSPFFGVPQEQHAGDRPGQSEAARHQGGGQEQHRHRKAIGAHDVINVNLRKPGERLGVVEDESLDLVVDIEKHTGPVGGEVVPDEVNRQHKRDK